MEGSVTTNIIVIYTVAMRDGRRKRERKRERERSFRAQNMRLLNIERKILLLTLNLFVFRATTTTILFVINMLVLAYKSLDMRSWKQQTFGFSSLTFNETFN